MDTRSLLLAARPLPKFVALVSKEPFQSHERRGIRHYDPIKKNAANFPAVDRERNKVRRVGVRGR